MRTLVLLGLAAALVACGSGSAAGTEAAAPATSLTVTYWENGPAAGGRERWTLACAPARGTLERPGLACRKLAAGGMRLFAPVPKDLSCIQIYGGPQVARVVGTLKGRRLSASFNLRDGCQISRWRKLSPWLLPASGA
jgi:hypothetical protein